MFYISRKKPKRNWSVVAPICTDFTLIDVILSFILGVNSECTKDWGKPRFGLEDSWIKYDMGAAFDTSQPQQILNFYMFNKLYVFFWGGWYMFYNKKNKKKLRSLVDLICTEFTLGYIKYVLYMVSPQKDKKKKTKETPD